MTGAEGDFSRSRRAECAEAQKPQSAGCVKEPEGSGTTNVKGAKGREE